MRLDVVIGQIKRYCPFFEGRVAGAAEWDQGVHAQSWLDTPAAYVVPLDGDASENADMGGAIYQNLAERVRIFVQFRNLDRRGQTVTENLEPVKYQLIGALLRWRPNSSVDNPGIVLPTDPGADTSIRGMTFVGHDFVASDLARLFYGFTFELVSVISDADGWQPPSVPLTDITGTITTVDGLTFDTHLNSETSVHGK